MSVLLLPVSIVVAGLPQRSCLSRLRQHALPWSQGVTECGAHRIGWIAATPLRRRAPHVHRVRQRCLWSTSDAYRTE